MGGGGVLTYLSREPGLPVGCCLASGRVLPVVQLAIGRSPSNFSVDCPARLPSRPVARIDLTRGGRNCAATVCRKA